VIFLVLYLALLAIVVRCARGLAIGGQSRWRKTASIACLVLVLAATTVTIAGSPWFQILVWVIAVLVGALLGTRARLRRETSGPAEAT
jgi:hypothetical protein